MSENPPPNGADGSERKTEREQFYVCPVCGERVDWRDPQQVMRHAGHGGPEHGPQS